MAPHTYHADKMASESLVDIGECNYGSVIQGFTKVPSSFRLACQKHHCCTAVHILP